MRIVACVGIGLLLVARSPVLTAQGGGERWVGTWSTSEVGRPQTPPPPVQGPPPFMRNECPPGPPPASGFIQFTNQTLRQIVHNDGVIDFDKATRDPNDPKRFLAAFDSCDHLHPSDAGYKAMAEAVDLALFKTEPVPGRTSRSGK